MRRQVSRERKVNCAFDIRMENISWKTPPENARRRRAKHNFVPNVTQCWQIMDELVFNIDMCIKLLSLTARSQHQTIHDELAQHIHHSHLQKTKTPHSPSNYRKYVPSRYSANSSAQYTSSDPNERVTDTKRPTKQDSDKSTPPPTICTHSKISDSEHTNGNKAFG